MRKRQRRRPWLRATGCRLVCYDAELSVIGFGFAFAVVGPWFEGSRQSLGLAFTVIRPRLQHVGSRVGFTFALIGARNKTARIQDGPSKQARCY